MLFSTIKFLTFQTPLHIALCPITNTLGSNFITVSLVVVAWLFAQTVWFSENID